MRLSIFQPASVSRVAESVPFADCAAQAGGRLWTGQSLQAEPHQALAALGVSHPGLDTGLAVSLAPLRHPFDAALAARSVSLLSGGTHVAGYGAGSRRFQAALRGEPYSAPLRAMEEYLDIVGDLLSGEHVTHEGEHYRVAGALAPVAAPFAVDLAAGVLRPGMARVAGRTCDAATTWLTPPAYIADRLRPACDEGASDRGRRAPRIVSVVHVVVDHDDRDPLHQAITASQAHLSMPHYRAMLADAGIDLGPDVVHAAAQLIEHGIYCFGSPAEIVEQLGAWEHAGVDEVALNVAPAAFTADADAALADLHDIVEAWAARRG